ASAVNDTSREMGGALGIAVAGSILAGRYSHVLAAKLANFPAPVSGPATDSLAKAVEVAGKLGPQGKQLTGVSKAAFLTAMHASTLVMAAIVAVAGLPDRATGSRASRPTATPGTPASERNA